MMKHFRKPNGAIYAFEADGSQDHLITEDMVEMTPQEVAEHTAPSANAQVMQQIFAIEATITPRRLREALLGVQESLDFIDAAEQQIAALRQQLVD